MTRTVGLYLGRQFLGTVLAIYAALLGLTLLVDTAELLRRSVDRPEVGFGIVVNLAVLHLPDLGTEMLPFAILFGGIFAFVRLTRSHELAVLRSAGVSVWQFIGPAVTVALLLGAIDVAVMNPIAASMLIEHERGLDRYLRNQSSLLAVSSTGLWLREVDAAGNHAVVHAAAIDQQTMRLRQVTIFRFHGEDEFVGRIDAERATLANGAWRLEAAWVTGPTKPGERVAALDIPTSLTRENLHESVASAETVSFWQLPRFIAAMDATGLSSLGHRLHWHALLARPLLFVAMVLIAAVVSMRMTRRGGTVPIVLVGLGTGFVLFVFTSVVQALGLGERVPIVLAAWTPSGVTMMLGLALLMHLEDG